jgi:hypothetical protein
VKGAARESALVIAILRALRAIPGVTVRKRHGTAMGVVGDADLYGSVNGRHFEIEVKRPGEPLTRLQRRRLDEWRQAGAITAIARSVEDAIAILRGGPPS